MNSNVLYQGKESGNARTAQAVLGQIARAFHFRDKDIFLGLYRQYIRPHLEFSVQAWSPWCQKDKDLLENVQKKGCEDDLRPEK